MRSNFCSIASLCILSLLVRPLFAANLVVNGSFDGGSCNGWTATPTPFNTSGFNQCLTSGGNPGGFAVLNDNPAVLTTMSQTISGLVVGTTYELSWDMKDVYLFYASSTIPGVGAQIDGQLWQFIVPNGQPWQHYVESFTYDGGSNVLSFSAQRNGTDTDAGFDNVTIAPSSTVTPEPSSLSLMILGVVLIGSLRFSVFHQFHHRGNPV